MAIIYQPAGRAREYSEWAANLYSGCGHGCIYCYAPSACRRQRNEFHATPKPRKNVLKQLEKDCQRLQGKKMPRILFCFTTDPYQLIEKEHEITRQAIKMLHDHGLAVQILTKGGSRAERDFDLLTPEDAFASTLTFLDEADSKMWEPGAASPQDRIDTIKEAHNAGIPTWVSLEPVIDPEQTLQIVRQTHEFVDLYKVGKLNYHPRAREVDWGQFTKEVVALLKSLGKRYYIKKDLQVFLETA